MDNLRSIVLGVVSSLIAAGIIALARSNRRWFTACGRALTVANLALLKGISRWLINCAVLWLPNCARCRFREEWLAHLDELGPFAALRHAISCTSRVRNLRTALRNERQKARTRPDNRIKALTNFAGALVTIVVCVLNAPGVPL